MLADYATANGVYDEAFAPDGRPRGRYAELLEDLSDRDLAALADAVRAWLRERDVTFDAAPGGLFALDPIPRLLEREEWQQIEAGILQRARALERFAADAYGERAIFIAGVMPERVLEGSAHYEPAMQGATPRVWTSVIGFDLVRAGDGRFRVLEDQIRMPSGLAYAAAAREVMEEVLDIPALRPAPVGDAFERLRTALRAAAPAAVGEPSIVLLSAGPDAAGWYEHERLGRELGIPVVTRHDLHRRNHLLLARIDGERAPVDVVYQRTDEDRFTDEEGERTPIGELLLEPCRAGRLACVNAPGAAVGDDKLVHAYVEEMVRFYLGEEPLLESITTYDLGVPEVRARALANLDELVVKPRGEMGGEGVVVFSQATEAERRQALEALERRPEELIAQRRVELSSHPTLCEGRLEPRRVDLRPYVIRAGEREWALPGGLTRVALERGSLIVNSGQGGGAKDTWVLR